MLTGLQNKNLADLCRLNKSHQFEPVISFTGYCACIICVCLNVSRLCSNFYWCWQSASVWAALENFLLTCSWIFLKQNINLQKRCGCMTTGFKDIHNLRSHFMTYKCHHCTGKCSDWQQTVYIQENMRK